MHIKVNIKQIKEKEYVTKFIRENGNQKVLAVDGE